MTKHWEDVRDYVCELYHEYDMSLSEIDRKLRREQNFKASTRAYRMKLKEWKAKRSDRAIVNSPTNAIVRRDELSRLENEIPLEDGIPPKDQLEEWRSCLLFLRDELELDEEETLTFVMLGAILAALPSSLRPASTPRIDNILERQAPQILSKMLGPTNGSSARSDNIKGMLGYGREELQRTYLDVLVDHPQEKLPRTLRGSPLYFLPKFSWSMDHVWDACNKISAILESVSESENSPASNSEPKSPQRYGSDYGPHCVYGSGYMNNDEVDTSANLDTVIEGKDRLIAALQRQNKELMIAWTKTTEEIVKKDRRITTANQIIQGLGRELQQRRAAEMFARL